MSQAWVNPQLLGAILGAGFGCAAGLWGTLAGILVPRGKARLFILTFGWSLLGCALLCLALAGVAYAAGQPHGIWYGFGLVGVIGLFVLPTGLFTMHRGYSQGEARRIQAEDLL
jgi:hypothetical protein